MYLSLCGALYVVIHITKRVKHNTYIVIRYIQECLRISWSGYIPTPVLCTLRINDILHVTNKVEHSIPLYIHCPICGRTYNVTYNMYTVRCFEVITLRNVLVGYVACNVS